MGTNTYTTLSGLDLSNGQTYVLSTRAYDSDNQLSDTTTTNGITIDVTLPTISQISAGNGVNQFLNSNDLFHGSCSM